MSSVRLQDNLGRNLTKFHKMKRIPRHFTGSLLQDIYMGAFHLNHEKQAIKCINSLSGWLP